MTGSTERNGSPHRIWKGGFETRRTSAPTALLARSLVAVYLLFANWLAAGLAAVRRRADRSTEAGLTVLAVGPFYSSNWVAAHLEPLGQSQAIEKVLVITPQPYASIENLEYLTPPAWLLRLTGRSIARAMLALVTTVRVRPGLVIGYHLPWNGVVALLLGRLAGARTAYFSVGGPGEIVGGGLYSEHALFSRQGRENPHAERSLLKLVNRFDDVLTMGSDGQRYFDHCGIDAPIWPVSVGVSEERFRDRDDSADVSAKTYDLIAVCRLARIKRIDLFLEVIARLSRQHPELSAVIVGEGDERAALERMIARLGIGQNVELAGWHEDVQPLLLQSRLFVMTSASEGLPLSLIEAMMCGLPAVVPSVGDLSDLVRNHANGYLVPPGDVAATADAVANLLTDAARQTAFSAEARRLASRFSVAECAKRWDELLTGRRG